MHYLCTEMKQLDHGVMVTLQVLVLSLWVRGPLVQLLTFNYSKDYKITLFIIMKTNYEIRYAAHPEDAKHYDTTRIRRDFLIEKVFAADEVNMVYSMYDRMVVGGAMPVAEELKL